MRRSVFIGFLVGLALAGSALLGYAADYTYTVVPGAVQKKWIELADGTYTDRVMPVEHDYNYVYNAAELGADLKAIFVDLSDTTGYPHTATNKIFLRDLEGYACLNNAAAIWTIEFGLVGGDTSNTGQGDITWFWSSRIAGVGCQRLINKPLMSGCSELDLTPDGGNVVSGKSGTAAGYGSADTMAKFAGGTGNPGPGDIVALITEMAPGGTLSFAAAVLYRTE